MGSADDGGTMWEDAICPFAIEVSGVKDLKRIMKSHSLLVPLHMVFC